MITPSVVDSVFLEFNRGRIEEPESIIMFLIPGVSNGDDGVKKYIPESLHTFTHLKAAVITTVSLDVWYVFQRLGVRERLVKVRCITKKFRDLGL